MPADRRSYDATKRRERARREIAQTRSKVVEAAWRLFAEQGYIATTVAQIATEAGVALQSVYKVGGNKAELLHLVSDLAVAGDHEELLMKDRADFRSVIEEPDPRTQLQRFGALHATIVDRALPIFAAERQAAAVDRRAADLVEEQGRRRRATYRTLVAAIEPGALRPGVDATQALDLLWAIASPELALQLRRSLGWSLAHHQRWLADTLSTLLLAPVDPP